MLAEVKADAAARRAATLSAEADLVRDVGRHDVMSAQPVVAEYKQSTSNSTKAVSNDSPPTIFLATSCGLSLQSNKLSMIT